jgi:DNA helicase-2/ATP-dependent DNA helicase PcrA
VLKNNRITPDIFEKVLDGVDILGTDKVRLRLILNVFKRYNQTLSESGLFDYRDAIIAAIDTLQKSDLLLQNIKNKFAYLFIDGFEDITYLQFLLIETISDSDRLWIYGDEYSRIQEFKGAWRDGLIFDTLSEHLGSVEHTELKGIFRNEDILTRALFLVQRYNAESSEPNFEKAEAVEYLKFDDIQSEIAHIAKDIGTKVEQGYSFSDFAILIRDFESKQKFIDFFKVYGIPINSELYNEEFQNFRLRALRYLNIFNLCQKLGVEEFSQKGFAEGKYPSKAQKEICFEELNLYVGNVVSDTIQDPYMKDKFFALWEQKQALSIMDVIWENIDILQEEDKSSLLAEFDFVSKLYEFFKEQDFVGLFLAIADNIFDWRQNHNFSVNFGKFLTKISQLCELHSSVIKAPVEIETVLDLLLFSSEEQKDESDAVNLMTFFKSSGLEFKQVYIPCLSEDNIPKKSKSTFFVSYDANDKVSQAFKKIAPNFKSLIELDEDSVKEETRLFYLGMTRAVEKLTISTHCYEEKKQVAPSPFFELLAQKDKQNYSEPQSEADIFDVVIQKEAQKIEKQKDKVIPDGEKLKLSPSAISNFLKCPKQYYYKNLLGIKESGTFAANYGNIVHSVMEVFSKTCLDKYNKESLIMLSEVLFNAKNNAETALQKGFKQHHIELVIATDELKLTEMKDSFFDAVEELGSEGFFQEIPDKILTEKSFSFEMKELDGVVFDGRIDAIFVKDGHYKLVDYKTGRTKDLSLEKLIAFVNKSGKEPPDMGTYLQSYDYQIPIYHFACQNAESLQDIKGKVSELALQYVRPVLDDGCIKDAVQADIIEEKTSLIVDNLKETVVSKIKEETAFCSLPEYIKCQRCSFAFLCNQDEGVQDGDD